MTKQFKFNYYGAIWTVYEDDEHKAREQVYRELARLGETCVCYIDIKLIG